MLTFYFFSISTLPAKSPIVSSNGIDEEIYLGKLSSSILFISPYFVATTSKWCPYTCPYSLHSIFHTAAQQILLPLVSDDVTSTQPSLRVETDQVPTTAYKVAHYLAFATFLTPSLTHIALATLVPLLVPTYRRPLAKHSHICHFLFGMFFVQRTASLPPSRLSSDATFSVRCSLASFLKIVNLRTPHPDLPYAAS